MTNSGRSSLDAGFVDEVRTRTDIVELIGEYVALRQRGRNYVGLCPFHTEKTPSFTVSAEKQFFHCFGCGAGGDVFSFLQRKEGLTFPESVRRLAERAGLKVPERTLTPAEAARRAEQERLRQVLELAAAQYERWLWGQGGAGATGSAGSGHPPGRPGDPGGAAALAYLRDRGFDDQTLKEFRIGWAPQSWDALVEGLRRRSVDVRLLVRAGLAGEAEKSGRVYDRFRGRVMFPICDARGRVIAFGGRLLPGAGAEAGAPDPGPKYLNSPETEFFAKGRGLYAFHLARGPIREQGRAIVVEGYVDAITCHRAGFRNTVASLGTALSAAQGRLLLALGREVLVAYDADAAGQAAALRGLEVLAELGADVRVVSLPGGQDPDECIRKEGAEAFAQAVAQAEDYLDYRFRVAREDAERQHGPGSVRAVAAVAGAVAPALAALSSAVAREAYVQRFARALGVGEASLLVEVRRAARSGQGGRPGAAAVPPAGHIGRLHRDNKGNAGSGLLAGQAYRRAEEQLIALALHRPKLAVELAGRLRAEEIPDEAPRLVLSALAQVAAAAAGDQGGDGAAGDEQAGIRRVHDELVRALNERGAQEAVALVARVSLSENDGLQDIRLCERIAQDCVRVLQEHSLGNRIIEVRQEVQRLEREGRPVPSRLLEELMRLQRSVKGAGALDE